MKTQSTRSVKGYRGLKPKGGGVVARPPVTNLGVAAEYARRLRAMNARMFAAAQYFIPQIYKRGAGVIVGDASPSKQTQAEVQKLYARHRKAYTSEAASLAAWFVGRINEATTASLYSSLRQFVPGVNPKLTPRVQNILSAATVSNVGLIKSIPDQYFDKLEQAVMRAMQTGRDLDQLKQDVLALGESTDKQADLIARDQANKATSSINIARQKDLGITRAVWLHVRGGVHPRQSHIEADGKEFDLATGCLIDGEYVQPGEPINCGCVAAPIIDAFA